MRIGEPDRFRLTRRDALIALAGGAGSAVAGLAAIEAGDRRLDREPGDEAARVPTKRLRAVAEVVYPSRIEATPEFIETYLDGLNGDRRARIVATLDRIDDYSRREFGGALPDVSSERRDALLRQLGVHRAPSVPDGTLPQRIRYHLVNGLLYLLYTTPKGGALFGIENPVGYPGGYQSYQNPPEQ